MVRILERRKKMGKLTITDGNNTYTIENCPEHISQIVSITIPTKDIETKLYVPIFLSHMEIKSQLQSLEDFLYKENDFANLSIADIYDEIDDVTDIEYSEWIEFNDRFWTIISRMTKIIPQLRKQQKLYILDIFAHGMIILLNLIHMEIQKVNIMQTLMIMMKKLSNNGLLKIGADDEKGIFKANRMV